MAGEVGAENSRKQEYMLKTFTAHRKSAASQDNSAGNRMYTKGIKMRENKERLVTQAMTYKTKIEVKGCTFKPKL